MQQMLPDQEGLQIRYLGRLFDNTSECYKLFWFQAILRRILEGKQEATYEEIIDEMIADAWYMVTEYHLNLGPKDTLEYAVNRLQELTGMKPSEEKEKVLSCIRDCKDQTLRKYKSTLTLNVPYRLLAPFVDFKGKDWDQPKNALVQRLNAYRDSNRLLYRFENVDGLKTRICFDEGWMEYLRKNQAIVQGWIRYNLVEYLQRRNPNVPGVIDKLYPPAERNLTDVQKYWKMILQIRPIREIYGDGTLSEKDLSIDHFVPWSYVANDELWNLHPTTRSINSAKSNNLPCWDVYFLPLAGLEYEAYELMWTHDVLHREFEKCKRKHLNSPLVEGRLYGPGLSREEFTGRLEEVVSPVYRSAKAAGFHEWRYE
ncbi:MAG: HNH endonuclease [Lachnospiraceae bacterium]|nr:HNH endonuclease [Lachnospiraceae bacterium]